MVYRYAAVALLAGLGCYRAPRIPSPAITDLGCVYDPVTEQLRVCLEPGMVGACASFGPACRGGGSVAQADLDVPVYKQSILYVPPAVEPAPVAAPPAEAYVAPVVVEDDGGYVGYVGGTDFGTSVGVGGGGAGGAEVVSPPPRPTRPPPPRGMVVPPRGYHQPPMPPRPPRPMPPRGLVDGLQPARPLGVPPVGRPDVAAEEPGTGGPIILRRTPKGHVIVAPAAQAQQGPRGRTVPGANAPTVKRAVPRRR